MSYLFGIETTRHKKLPQPEENGPKGRAGWPSDKNFKFLTFFIKGTPAQMGLGTLLSYAIFWGDAPCGLQGSRQ